MRNLRSEIIVTERQNHPPLEGSRNFYMNQGFDSYVGRIAPSPTGAQHLGNARTYLLAWLIAQVNDGKLLLRIEDLDTPRTKVGATKQIFEDLRWLGLTWDSTVLDQTVDHVVQSERVGRHIEILEQLKSLELVYPCTCTRKEVEESSSAPHESTVSQAAPLDGVVYPGRCSYRRAGDAAELDRLEAKYAWRFRFGEEVISWGDDFAGIQSLHPKSQLGDFVVARNYGPPAYQLAVVVDDHDCGVNHVVRGDDLIYSTYRQLAIYKALGWQAPNWFHVPLVVGNDGRRLAKRHGDTRLITLKEHGVSAQDLIGQLAHSLGIIPAPRRLEILELRQLVLADPEWLRRIPKSPVQIPISGWLK